MGKVKEGEAGDLEVIEDLQSRIAFQEDMITKLNDIVASQELELNSIQKQLRLIYKKVDQLALDDDLPESTIEKPPHY